MARVDRNIPLKRLTAFRQLTTTLDSAPFRAAVLHRLVAVHSRSKRSNPPGLRSNNLTRSTIFCCNRCLSNNHSLLIAQCLRRFNRAISAHNHHNLLINYSNNNNSNLCGHQFKLHSQ